MTMRTKRTPRSEKLDLRLTGAAKKMLQMAAAADRKSVTDFVLDSALRQAEERLADRQHFRLGAAKWNAFLTALDAPARERPRLKRLLTESGVFDGGARR